VTFDAIRMWMVHARPCAHPSQRGVVSPLVNSPKHNEPACIEKADAAGAATPTGDTLFG